MNFPETLKAEVEEIKFLKSFPFDFFPVILIVTNILTVILTVKVKYTNNSAPNGTEFSSILGIFCEQKAFGCSTLDSYLPLTQTT